MISYTCGLFDILRAKDLQDLDQQIQLSKEQGAQYFAIGIYDETLSEKLGLNTPLKSLEDRMNIMRQIRGIDFVFPVFTLEEKVLKKNIKEAYKEFLESQKNNEKNEKKKYKIAYAPGTYDLFHAGHLENLLIASHNTEKLIVGIKSDELVKKHKNKIPIISDEERIEILRHFRFVYDVYKYYTRDLHVAKDWIKSKYNELDAIFLGSDLKEDFKNVDNLNIIFTERKKELMQTRSTTAYAKKYKSLKLGDQDNKKYKGHIEKNNNTISCEKIKPLEYQEEEK